MVSYSEKGLNFVLNISIQVTSVDTVCESIVFVTHASALGVLCSGSYSRSTHVFLSPTAGRMARARLL